MRSVREYYLDPKLYEDQRVRKDYEEALKTEYLVTTAIRETAKKIGLGERNLIPIEIDGTLYSIVVSKDNNEDIEILGSVQRGHNPGEGDYCQVLREFSLVGNKLALTDQYWLIAGENSNYHTEDLATVKCEYDGSAMTNYLYDITAIQHKQRV